MEENNIHKPLLQCDEKVITTRESRDSSSVTLNFDPGDAAPILSESHSDKWKFKHHCILSGEVFCESLNHSQGTQLFSPNFKQYLMFIDVIKYSRKEEARECFIWLCITMPMI